MINLYWKILSSFTNTIKFRPLCNQSNKLSDSQLNNRSFNSVMDVFFELFDKSTNMKSYYEYEFNKLYNIIIKYNHECKKFFTDNKFNIPQQKNLDTSLAAIIYMYIFILIIDRKLFNISIDRRSVFNKIKVFFLGYLIYDDILDDEKNKEIKKQIIELTFSLFNNDKKLLKKKYSDYYSNVIIKYFKLFYKIYNDDIYLINLIKIYFEIEVICSIIQKDITNKCINSLFSCCFFKGYFFAKILYYILTDTDDPYNICPYIGFLGQLMDDIVDINIDKNDKVNTLAI